MLGIEKQIIDLEHLIAQAYDSGCMEQVVQLKAEQEVLRKKLAIQKLIFGGKK